jgi:hypothetical protein
MSQRLVNNRSYYDNSASSRLDDRYFEVSTGTTSTTRQAPEPSR